MFNMIDTVEGNEVDFWVLSDDASTRHAFLDAPSRSSMASLCGSLARKTPF